MEAMATDELSQVMAKLNVENYKSAVQYIKFLYDQQQTSSNTALSHEDSLVQQELSSETRNELVYSLAGLWQDHDNNLPVEEYVRSMRKGRKL